MLLLVSQGGGRVLNSFVQQITYREHAVKGAKVVQFCSDRFSAISICKIVSVLFAVVLERFHLRDYYYAIPGMIHLS